MTSLNKLPSISSRPAKRVGRGIGSGKGGHTSGRGQKGQKSRKDIGLTFEGTKIKKSILKRLPLQRGKGRFHAREKRILVVNLKYLNVFKKDSLVNVQSLIKQGIIGKDAVDLGVKILGDGDLKTALKVALPCSKGAAKKITKAGGEVVKAEK